MAMHGSRKDAEQRRLQAMTVLERGYCQSEVARQVGVTPGGGLPVGRGVPPRRSHRAEGQSPSRPHAEIQRAANRTFAEAAGALFDQNIHANEAELFVADLLAHFPKGTILVWDCWMVHRSATRRLRQRFPKRVCIEWLPSYAPELNPDEQVWNRTRHTDLANYIPGDVDYLATAVYESLCRTGSQQGLLRSFFKHAGISL